MDMSSKTWGTAQARPLTRSRRTALGLPVGLILALALTLPTSAANAFPEATAAASVATGPAPIGPGTIADPLPDPGFQNLIDEAIASGAESLTLTPGTYAVAPAAGDNRLLRVHGATDLTIDATGVTIVGTTLARAIDIRDSTNLTIKGLTITYDPLPFTQGEIVAVAADLGSIDVRLDDGYPQKAYTRATIYDAATQFQKAGINHLWGTTAAFVEAGVVRVTLAGIGRNAAVGDPVTLSGGPEGEPHAISMEMSSGTRLEHVTLHTAAGFGLVDTSGDGGTVLDHFRLVPGTPPPGATKAPLLTAIWDGLQFQSLGTGPTVVNSEIRNAGDDSFSITSRAFPVLKADGNRLIVGFPDPWRAEAHQIGDRLAQFRDGPSVHITDITKIDYDTADIDPAIRAQVDTAANQGWSKWNLDRSNSVFELTVDDSEVFSAGDFLYNPDRMGNGFVFSDNVVRSPGRGILLKAGDGVIEGNVFEGGDKAIQIANENEADSHGGAPFDLTIRDNVFRGTGYHHDMPWSDQAGSVGMAGANVVSERAYENILIEDNVFEGIRGLNLNISDAEDVTVRRNVFRDTHRTDAGGAGANGADKGIPSTAVVYVARADRVAFKSTTIESVGPFAAEPVVIDPTATRVKGVDALRDGVPTVTVKEGTEFTAPTGTTYDQISFKLYSPRKIDKVVLNGVTKNLSNNVWSDVNFVKPGVFGAVKGHNELVVYDARGATRTITFTLN
jgi:hypothetical protein